MSFKIVGIGEVLWDLLPDGRQLGGAPANFTYHATALGADTKLVSRVGSDALGRETLERLGQLGVSTECVEIDEERPTGSVGVTVGVGGQPQYEIHENVAWDAIRGEAAARQAVAAADAVCFGSLAQRCAVSRASIQALVSAAPASALRIFDINLRQHYHSREIIEQSLSLANVLKVNDAELPRLVEWLGITGDVRAQIQQLVARFGLRAVVLTRGGDGSLLYADSQWSDRPGAPTTIVDTIGAGDSFTAAMTLGLLKGWDLDRINDHANRLAAFVCSQAGAMPSLPESFRRWFAD
jgi:fructokinase